jgi:selenide,water dikinase
MGHAVEMARGAGLTLELHWSEVPLIPAAVPLAQAGLFPGGARANLEAYRDSVAIDSSLAEWQALSLADPQTSGGLLIAFAPEQAHRALSDLAEAGVPARMVGRVSQRQDKEVVVSAHSRPARGTL